MALGDALRLVCVTGFEIGVDGQIHRGHDFRDMRQRLRAGDRPIAVRQAVRKREPGAGGGQGLEPEMTEVSGGAGVPRVGNHEAALLMELAECGAASGEGH
jgi:hypothetical protein